MSRQTGPSSSSSNTQPPAATRSTTEETSPTTIRYPPFPSVPPGVKITPFTSFQECGIRLYGIQDPEAPEDNEENFASKIEVDGLGIPTIPLVDHDINECKTFTRRRNFAKVVKKKLVKDSTGTDTGTGTRTTLMESGKKDPLAIAHERAMLFANKEWYEQWAEGEASRGTQIYDSNISIIDRIHSAASHFRSRRVWPPYSTRVTYLWDQFRIYAGLLGEPPVWYRTDLQQSPDDALDEEDEDELFVPPPKQKDKGANRSGKERDISVLGFSDEDDSLSDDDATNSKGNHLEPATTEHQDEADTKKRKRIPPRTPYALHNIEPIPLSSASQVKTLLSLASLRKHQKLLAFIASPDTSLQIFLSWYLHHQGFIYSPVYLSNLPRLVLFFVEFLYRTKAIQESDRALRKAVEVAKKAVEEVPGAGRLCRVLPDEFGTGCLMLWGKRWVDEEQEKQPFFVETNPLQETETKEEAMRKFEEELMQENVQIISSDKLVPPKVQETIPGVVDDDDCAHISIEFTSPTSPGFVEPDQAPAAFIEEVTELESSVKAVRVDSIPQATMEPVASASSTVVRPTSMASSAVLTNDEEPKADSTPYLNVDPALPATSTDSEFIPRNWDTDDPTCMSEAHEAWKPQTTQPLMALFGMTVLPLKYEAGLVERSMRKVKAVVKPGEKAKEGLERKWRGVQEELVEKLARVVLEPWRDWDDGGLAEMYRKPRVQSPMKEGGKDQGAEGEKEKEKTEHDPTTDVIVVLVEPRVVEHISIGMGLAGTWVQIVRIRGQKGERDSEHSGRGGYRGRRGRGRGQGRGRGGPSHTGTSTSGGQEDSSKTTGKEADPQEPLDVEPTPADVGEKKADASGSKASPARGIRGGGRGRGRGGSGQHTPFQPEKEFVFWYVEDLFMAVPSFWMVGKEEEPLKMEDGDEDDNEDDDMYV